MLNADVSEKRAGHLSQFMHDTCNDVSMFLQKYERQESYQEAYLQLSRSALYSFPREDISTPREKLFDHLVARMFGDVT